MSKINYYSLLKSTAEDSYYEFLLAFWHTVVKETLVPNWHMKYLCDEVQIAMERVFKGQDKEYDLNVNVCPGSSKSSIFSIFLVPWCWTRMPSLRCIGVSYSETLAFDLSDKANQVVKSPLYQHCWPNIQIRRDVDSKSQWANTLGGVRYAVGSGGSLTGRHAHLLSIDDITNAQAAHSKADMESTNRFAKETLASRKVDKRVSVTMNVQQRISVDDTTAMYLERGGMKHICLPAEELDNINPPELRKFYVDGLFDVNRIPREVLQQAKADMGQAGYAAQMNQMPIVLGGGMFKISQIETEYSRPPDSDFVKIVRAWDKAATADAGADYTVGVLMGQHKNGSFWVLDVVRAQLATDAREALILKTAQRDGRSVHIVIEQEPGSAGVDSAKQTIRRLAGFHVEAEKATGKKELRADTYSVQLNAGNVFVVRAPWRNDYVYELGTFPAGRNDDQVDASSLAFSKLHRTRARLGTI
jgi:predicted phage terminase large subunit-like protein